MQMVVEAGVLAIALLVQVASEPDKVVEAGDKAAQASQRAAAAKQRLRDRELDRLCQGGRWPRGYAEAVLEDRERAIEAAHERLLAFQATKTKKDAANSPWAKKLQGLTISWQKKKQRRLRPLELPEMRSPANWEVGEICLLEHLEVVGVVDEQTLAVTLGGHRLAGTRRAETLDGRLGSLQPVVELTEHKGVRITHFPTEAENGLALAKTGIYRVVNDKELKYLGACKP